MKFFGKSNKKKLEEKNASLQKNNNKNSVNTKQQRSSSTTTPVPPSNRNSSLQVVPPSNNQKREPPPEASRKQPYTVSRSAPPPSPGGGIRAQSPNNAMAASSSAALPAPVRKSQATPPPPPPRTPEPSYLRGNEPPNRPSSSPPPPASVLPQQTLPSQPVMQQSEGSMEQIDLTRNLVKRFIADIWNRGETDLIPELCSPSLRFNGNSGFDRVGHDGLARMVTTIRDSLEDYHCEIHSMVVEHNKAFCRLRFTGKHTGNLLGYPPTGCVVGWMGATEFTVQNGKILKVWELGDIKTLEEQLIVTKTPVLGNDDDSDE